jgi:hypothetical protein
MRQSAQHFGIAWERYRLIGVAELAEQAPAGVGLLVSIAYLAVAASA